MSKVLSDIKLDFKDVLILPKFKYTSLKSRNDVNLEVEYSFKHTNYKWKGIPIIAANMDTIGTFEMCKELYKKKMLTAIHKHYSRQDWLDFYNQVEDKNIFDYICVSTGISDEDFSKMSSILDDIKEIKFICIDVANGYSCYLMDFIVKCRDRFKDHVIIAGNIVTGDMAKRLIEIGVDIVKIGIGPGSVCTTRKKTGIGYPQFSAILDCYETVKKIGGRIISDGGCIIPGDLSKAFGAGADFVMLGGMLSGHDECSGDIVEFEGKKYKEFYGMSSEMAMKKYKGNVAEYRASEGKSVKVPYKGSVITTLNDILGGVRSTCTYTNSRSLSELYDNCLFIRVNQQANEVFN